MAFKLFNLFAGASGPAALSVAVSGTASGTVTTLSRLLGSSSTFSLLSGSNSNLTLSGLNLQAAAALGAGASQQVIVREYDSATLRAVEYPVTVSTPAVAPAAPTLGTPTVGDGVASIPFVDGSNGGSAITAHKVYRSTNAGSETLLGTLTGASPFLDSGLTNGTAYFYKLSAVNGVGEGPLSAEVSATPTAQVYLPADPSIAAVYSLHKLVSNYTGPLATVCASTAPSAPTSTIDVYANADGTPDLSAATNAFGSSFDIWKQYDQKGSYGPAQRDTAAMRPTIAPTLWGGFRAWHGGKVGSLAADARNSLQLPNTIVTDRRNAAQISVVAGPNEGNDKIGLMSLGSSEADSGGNFVGIASVTANYFGWRTRGNAENTVYLAVDQQPCIVAQRLSASGNTYIRNEQKATTAAWNAGTLTGGCLGDFGDTTNVQSVATGFAHLADIIFTANPADANFAAVQAALKSRFKIPTRTSQVIFSGSSIDVGLGQATTATIPGLNYQMALAGQLTRDPLMLTMGHGGWRYGDLANGWGSGFFPAMFQPTFARNVLYLGGDTNAIQNGVANSQILSDLDTILGWAKNAGFVVVVGTVIPRSSFSATQETQRQQLNASIKSNAAAKGYSVADLGDTPYATVDGTHPTAAAYQAMAPIIKAAINAVLA